MAKSLCRYIMPKSRIQSNVANMSFNTIRENKVLAKISEFTVVFFIYSMKYPTSQINFSEYHVSLNSFFQ